VLRELLREVTVTAGRDGPEATIRRAITAAPGHGAETVLAAR
jgi:hypothetical protein